MITVMTGIHYFFLKTGYTSVTTMTFSSQTGHPLTASLLAVLRVLVTLVIQALFNTFWHKVNCNRWSSCLQPPGVRDVAFYDAGCPVCSSGGFM